MRLVKLDPRFLRYDQTGEDRILFPHVSSIEAVQGIKFLCPKCFRANGSAIATHVIICWSRSRGVPDEGMPGPGRWALRGTGYGDLTIDADPPSKARSIALKDGCAWHGFVKNGEVTDA